jgi:hypothetical protein
MVIIPTWITEGEHVSCGSDVVLLKELASWGLCHVNVVCDPQLSMLCDVA